jgi:hypothetical protein
MGIVRRNIFHDNQGGGVHIQVYKDEALYNYGHRIYNNTLTGNFSWGSTTGVYCWEAINVSVKSLLPGNYFVTVNFSDYLDYDTVAANSSFVYKLSFILAQGKRASTL